MRGGWVARSSGQQRAPRPDVDWSCVGCRHAHMSLQPRPVAPPRAQPGPPSPTRPPAWSRPVLGWRAAWRRAWRRCRRCRMQKCWRRSRSPAGVLAGAQLSVQQRAGRRCGAGWKARPTAPWRLSQGIWLIMPAPPCMPPALVCVHGLLPPRCRWMATKRLLRTLEVACGGNRINEVGCAQPTGCDVMGGAAARLWSAGHGPASAHHLSANPPPLHRPRRQSPALRSNCTRLVRAGGVPAVLDIVQPFMDLTAPLTEVCELDGQPSTRHGCRGQARTLGAGGPAHRPRLVAAPATQAEARAPSVARQRGLSVCRNALSLLGVLALGTFKDASTGALASCVVPTARAPA